MKRDVYERVDDAIQEGKLWRAKEILQGNISACGYDRKLFEKYGQLLLLQRELIEAGKYLFLSAARRPEYEEAISLYLDRFTRKEPRNLLWTFPFAARLRRIEDYPDAVSQTLAGLSIGQVHFPGAGPAGGPPSRWARRIRTGGCLAVVVFLAVCLGVGVGVVVRWVFRAIF